MGLTPLVFDPGVKKRAGTAGYLIRIVETGTVQLYEVYYRYTVTTAVVL